jgi:hypothetical protein
MKPNKSVSDVRFTQNYAEGRGVDEPAQDAVLLVAVLVIYCNLPALTDAQRKQDGN